MLPPYKIINARDVIAARDEILNVIRGYPKNKIIYFHGWSGFGATAVLRSIAQALRSMKSPPKLCFSRTIYIDCSIWESRRVMQRKIAEELRLDRKTMDKFEEQDEEDDFNGVDHASRDVIQEVSEMIRQILGSSRFMMILVNGSSDEVSLSEFGIPTYYGTIIWTLGRRFVTVNSDIGFDFERVTKKLRHTNLYIYTSKNAIGLSDSQLEALFHEEVANIVARYPFMSDYHLTMFINCCRYGFFLRRSFHRTIGLDWASHASNFWICDGIIQQDDRAKEICNALDSEIILEGNLLDRVFPRLMQHPETSNMIVGNTEKYEKQPYRWISITSKMNLVQGSIQNILASASTVFLSSDKTFSAPRLPNAMFKQCNKLGVLILSRCAFSFVSPPFLHCNTLRFLGLGNCTHHNNTSELETRDCITKRTSFLQELLVLDLRYTDWAEMLSEENIDLMTKLTELNIEGVRCWQYAGQQQKILPHLRRLRMIKPAHHEETTSFDINISFMDKEQLEIVDLSGNNDMKSLPRSLSEASKLQVLVLDGCDGLEKIELPNTSLRSFSFDGYGPASHWTSTSKHPPMSSRPKHPSSIDKKAVRACKISLKGCTSLEDLFLRGLPNLEELDLSGCMIRVLDFGAMVVDLPKLKRLFLLGCECLHAIKWGSDEHQSKVLELICIDTRPRSGRMLGCPRALCLHGQQRSFQLQVHAILVDARLARSLWAPIKHKSFSACYFNINITSSAASMGTIQPESTKSKEMMIESSDHQRHYASQYCDVSTKVGDVPIPMQTFPQGPTEKLDHHIEIGDGSCSVQSEVEAYPFGHNLATLMKYNTESLHVHDVPTTCSNTMPIGYWGSLRWCRVERCPNLYAVFPPGPEEEHGKLETIWASDLLIARCVWSKNLAGGSNNRFICLQHLYLRSCPGLQFGLVMGTRPSFPNLETIHIIHCGALRHIFVSEEDELYQHTIVKFPKLTTIHLHDVPALRQICEAAETLAPALETIRLRGCWSLRRLPALKGRNEPGMKKATVEIEKDVWDALEWDGVDASHHPSLYEAPVHSRYYKRRRMLRGTVLR